MNILIAPNSMKGSLNAPDFATAVEKGFRTVSPVFNIRKIPVADGGDFTGEILNKAFSAKTFVTTVNDPSGKKTEAKYGIFQNTAIIEMAEASGMRLLKKEELNPLINTTFGTGQLIKAALDRGCTKIILGIGGSATIDGGIGMLDALGFSFYDKNDRPLPGKVESLSRVKSIRYPGYWHQGTEIIVLSDVNNPLLGAEGSVAVFGPQKGADSAMMGIIESGLANWISLLEKMSGKSIRDLPGAGAAGGIATGLVALLSARLLPGADFILDVLNMDQNIRWADWIFTGEGRIDRQSLNRKAPEVLAGRAKAMGKPISAIAGSFHPEASGSYNSIFTICRGPISSDESMARAGELVFSTSVQIAGSLLKSFPGLEMKHQSLVEAEKLINSNRPGDASNILSGKDLMNLAGYWYLAGRIGQKQQKWDEAINNFIKCLEIDTGHPTASFEIAILQSILNFRNPDLLNP
jgi:glycerate 2-kinase